MSSRFVAVCIVSCGLWLPAAVLAADQAKPAEDGREAMKVMNLGNPHEGKPTEADAGLEKKIEQKRSEELAEWGQRHTREIYPGMGVGGHQAETDKGETASK